MVIRILRTRVQAASVRDFKERAMVKLADARKVDGVIDAYIGSQADGSGHQFVFITRWRTIEALYAWAGGRDLLARPIYFDGLEDALLDFDIQHYVDLEATD
jgi:heme-degrading monooxygenase HmoA